MPAPRAVAPAVPAGTDAGAIPALFAGAAHRTLYRSPGIEVAIGHTSKHHNLPV